MPYKHNADRRHHIAKTQFRISNWPEYEAGLRRRGSLTLWMTPEALAGWRAPRRKTRGGQPRYSDLAIETALTLGYVFGMRLRQTEGLMNSVFDLMGLDIPVPDHTTLSRRAQKWKPPAPAGRPAARAGRQHGIESLRRRAVGWPIQRSPGSRTRSFRTCQGLRHAGSKQARKRARPSRLPPN
jgi:hypothetical protein